MINGDVRDFLQRRDRNEWTVLYKGRGYFFQTVWEPEIKKRTHPDSKLERAYG